MNSIYLNPMQFSCIKSDLEFWLLSCHIVKKDAESFNCVFFGENIQKVARLTIYWYHVLEWRFWKLDDIGDATYVHLLGVSPKMASPENDGPWESFVSLPILTDVWFFFKENASHWSAAARSNQSQYCSSQDICKLGYCWLVE